MAGSPHRRHLHSVEGTRRRTRCSGQNRLVTRSLFLWLQDRLGLGKLAAAKGCRRASRGWHGRKLSCISPDRRRPYHRCNQRITHCIDGDWQRRMGRRPYRPVRRAARHIARNNRLCRRSWHDIAGTFWRTHPHCGYGGGPASRHHRPRLLCRWPDQGNIWHGRVCADANGHDIAPVTQPSVVDDFVSIGW